MVNAHFGGVLAALQNVDRTQLDRLLALVRATKEREGVIWLCGNGGSYLTAQHWALDLAKYGHTGAIALGCNPGQLTAVANDETFDHIFSVELQQWTKPGDLLICLSCSGTSPNIRAAVSAAHELGLASVLLTGTVHDDVVRARHILRVWSQDYAVIEDCHSVIGHWLTKALTR